MPKGLKALLEPSTLASAFSQEVQPGTADLGSAVDHDLFDARGAHQEGSLNANPVTGHSADREGGVITAPTHVQDGAFKNLHAFPITLLNF
jgi:hypothetical protein